MSLATNKPISIRNLIRIIIKFDHYFLNIKYASPAFTFGLYFTNVQEFKQIQYTLKLYSKMDNPIIKYKALDSSLAQEINDNINNKDEVDYKCIEEDDFCVISK